MYKIEYLQFFNYKVEKATKAKGGRAKLTDSND
jgi:hypothetical protein